MENIPFETVNAGATEEDIITLEKRFHFQMPQDFKEFYLKHNGVVFLNGVKLNPDDCQLRYFYSVGQEYQEYILTIDKLLEWQEMDGFIPMYYIPFCADEAGDSYYVRVDGVGYGKIYYIFSEFLDEFLSDPESEGLIAGSFTEFWEMIHFPK